MDDFYWEGAEATEGGDWWAAEAMEGQQSMATEGGDWWAAEAMEGQQSMATEGGDLWAAEAMEGQQSAETTAGSGSRGMECGWRGMGCVLDFVKEDPIGVTISPTSLCPPHLTGDRASISGAWALLDLKAYIADCPKAITTAKGLTRAGYDMEATLCIAAPPRVSHLCIHCPDLTASDFGTEPTILATCDGLILFKAAICYASVCFEPAMQDFFIYQAPLSRMEGRPSLTRLPHPRFPFNIFSSMVGLKRRSDDDQQDNDGPTLRPHGIGQQHYIIAVLHHPQGTSDFTRYDLHRFDSKEGKWTTKALQLGHVAPSPGLDFFFHIPHKVITLGGGFMGWVDLCCGIMLCDVLVDHPELHYIPLPYSPEADKRMPHASADTFQDIAVIQGQIKYVEHQTEFSKGTFVPSNWTVTMWTRGFTPNRWEEGWHSVFKHTASDIKGSVSKLLNYNETPLLPPSCNLQTGHPILSLDEDIVYVLAKVDQHKAFVIAINMRDGMLQAAEHFGAERTLGISRTYTQYRTSHLQITPGETEKQKKRRGSLLRSLSNKKPAAEMTRGAGGASTVDWAFLQKFGGANS